MKEENSSHPSKTGCSISENNPLRKSGFSIPMSQEGLRHLGESPRADPAKLKNLRDEKNRVQNHDDTVEYSDPRAVSSAGDYETA